MPYSIYEVFTEITDFGVILFVLEELFFFSIYNISRTYIMMVFAINTTCSKIIRPTRSAGGLEDERRRYNK